VRSCWSLLSTRHVGQVNSRIAHFSSYSKILQGGQICFCFNQAGGVLLYCCLGSGTSALAPTMYGNSTS
jgi:hypothetical protein